MIAYNRTWLKNIEIDRAARRAGQLGLLTGEETVAILARHPVGFFTPNSWIRIGLFLLTPIAFSSAAALIGIAGAYEYPVASSVVIGLAALVCLEIFIRQRHYRSGVDDALLLIAYGSFCVVAPALKAGPAVSLAVSTGLALALFARYPSGIIGVIGLLSLLGLVNYLAARAAYTNPALFFFVSLPVIAVVYTLARRRVDGLRLPLAVIRIACLVLAWGAGNRFVLESLAFDVLPFDVFNLSAAAERFFWIWTFTLPVVYIAVGLIRRKPDWYRIGALLLVAAFASFRHYYALLPIETALTIVGILLLAIGAFFFHRLKGRTTGYTSDSIDPDDKRWSRAVSIATALQQGGLHQPVPASGTIEFGGGSGGGGGAGGEF